MSPRRSPEYVAVVLTGAVIVALVVSALLAPIMIPAGCDASPDPDGDPFCTTYPAQTLLGLEANVWLWAGVLVIVAAIAIWLLFWHKPRAARH